MEPLITDADIAAVESYMRSGGWITEFKETRNFERSIAEFTGARYCTVTPSGTMALFLALAVCGIGPGDEVIVPDLTMAASATAVLLTGAKVVFADIEPRTFCLDPDCADRAISRRTKAIMFVSLNGRSPAGFASLVQRWQNGGLRVIEDAAQSLGSYSEGKHLGTLGDCGCFSFSSQKIITTGQGGAVITNDEALCEKMRLLRDFGRREGGSDHYSVVGWNLKFTDLQAALGLEQMRRLATLSGRKRQIFEWYAATLSAIPEIELPQTDLREVTPWFMDVLVAPDEKAALISHLSQAGVGSRRFYPSLHTTPALKNSGSYPIANMISRRGLWLPSSLTLDLSHVFQICDTIRAFYGR